MNEMPALVEDLIAALIADVEAWEPGDYDSFPPQWATRMQVVDASEMPMEGPKKAVRAWERALDAVDRVPAWIVSARLRPTDVELSGTSVEVSPHGVVRITGRGWPNSLTVLTAIGVCGPPDAPHALVVHQSGEQSFGTGAEGGQSTVLLPGNPWFATDAPIVFDLGYFEDGSDNVHLMTRDQALDLIAKSADIRVRGTYSHLHPVCSACWYQPEIHQYNDHPQQHHPELGLCVDAGVIDVVDAVLARGWQPTNSCEGGESTSQAEGWDLSPRYDLGYVGLDVAELPAAVTEALRAAGCVVEGWDSGPTTTVIRWPAGKPHLVVEAVTAPVPAGS
jgi:hypothetical protein